MPNIAWQALQSHHWNAGGYDADSATLTVQATNGAMYQARGVPQTVADTFFQTSSPGAFWHDKIKTKYTVVKTADGMTKTGRKSRKQF
jgi:KTSC domain